jgi:glycine dehydrogenase
MHEEWRTLDELEAHDEFVRRHVGPSEAEMAAMLQTVGAASLDDLIRRTVPASIRIDAPLALPPARTEAETLDALRLMADRNEVAVSLMGMGYHATIMPGVILRRILENPGWYTAYTPYQAEVSQGRLEALLNWQQMVCDLTGMELANASLLDEATAAAEAMAMAQRIAKARSDRFFVDRDTHPQTLAVVRTRAEPLGIEVVTGDPATDLDQGGFFAALLSYPGSSGEIRDIRPFIQAIQAQQGIACVASDLLALVLLAPPGEMGADIVLGSAQRFGVPMGYGGPHAAFFATRDAHKRLMPGRIIGVSVDSHGRPALRMALQTREQHIRREKATSNICTAQVLLAVIAGMYAVYHGPIGLRRIATRVHRLTGLLMTELQAAGIAIDTTAFFDTLTLHLPGRARAIWQAGAEAGLDLRLVDADRLGLSLDETSNVRTVSRVLALLGREVGADSLRLPEIETIPPGLRRQTGFLGHPVFNSHHSETDMLRYLRRLQAKDVALDRSMIPLGSCTMKLNATTEMEPVTWRGFSALHPFAPLKRARGYRQLFDDLEAWLAEITGYDAVSLQPNAGSQGEYAGLLVIRAFHASRGEGQRDVCLIPSSAHGTNPASAVLAGMRVVVVGCDSQGNVDVEDLRAKAAQHAGRLAALMITYPSTHGVFEAAVGEICAIVHEHGGQVYLDGANLNALVGVAKPGLIGADVSHINLHKTFCIPHGGGGPGMGPIGVKAHLAPFLPGHPVVPGVNPHGAKTALGAVSAAPWGSASILTIPWAYIAMMGPAGLLKATQVAILNANYIARRLAPHYPVVYTGQNGMVAHECIIDLRQIKEATGITAEDVAKRLVDYGFHAPTMSWPVPETMMIEPTESEAQPELDRFCDAMIAIRDEIREIERGDADRQDNPLKRAPHTADLLLADWTRPYSREAAFFPLPWVKDDKYWPPVGRVDNVYGDRHLVCTCPPIEDYQQAAE